MAFNCFMHERNIYKERPDFVKIANDYPEFKKYAITDKKGKCRVDFNDADALRALTKILLKKDFDLNVEIPDGYLIPTVPQRLNYILWIEDLLTVLSKPSTTVSGIDIGTGPCAILALLGSKKNGWHFASTDTASEAVEWANKNIGNNNLGTHIKVTKVNKGTVLHDLMAENEESYNFCVCNPPFFEDKDDIRKKRPRMKEKLELFAKKEEIFSEGGEVSFVKQLLKDSIMFKDRISLYSSMFGKKKSFIEILKELQNIEGVVYTKTEFCQGNTIRWGIAWTFLKEVNFEKIERKKPKKPKKAKPPLVHSISRKLAGKDGNILSLLEVLDYIRNILLELEIESKIIKSAVNFAEVKIISNKNTWSHQRRKRREQLKVDKKPDVKDEILLSACINKSDLGDVGSLKNVSRSTASCTLLEPVQVIKNEAISVDDHSDTVTLNEQNKNKATDSLLTLKDSISQKRKRNEEEFDLDVKLNVLQDPDNECILEKNSSEAKRLKTSEDKSLSNVCIRKIQLDTLPKKRMRCAESQYQEEEIHTHQIKHQDETFETVPLLYCILKLRTTKDTILLDMNCPPECNRETMHQLQYNVEDLDMHTSLKLVKNI